MIIYNPKSEKVEFFYGGTRQEWLPKETKMVDEAFGEFILDRARVGLVEHSPGDEVADITSVKYVEMSWQQLISLASERKIFLPGMKREKIIKLMEDYDAERGTVQKSSN